MYILFIMIFVYQFDTSINSLVAHPTAVYTEQFTTKEQCEFVKSNAENRFIRSWCQQR